MPIVHKVLTDVLKVFNVMGLNYEQDDVRGDEKEEKLINSITKFRDSMRENAKS